MKFKHLVPTISLIVISNSFLCAQDFITKWTSTEAFTQLSFQALTIGTVNYTWTTSLSGNSGSGSFTMVSADRVILNGMNCPANDTLTLSMSPNKLRRFFFVDGNDNGKLIDVSQWGSVPWYSMQSTFSFCNNLANFTARDIPDLSNVNDMSYMFYEATSFNHDIGNWNTANVLNMNAMFLRATAFNQNIGNWNTANVKDMSNMFVGASTFNQDIGNWNTANVTKMNIMFYEATSFNHDIGNWNTANVIKMNAMFYGASTFNQDIGNWNTSQVRDMSYMFRGASTFNQDIGNWNTANVEDMNSMFVEASTFNQDIGNWNTANVISMNAMFYGASTFNQDIGNWNTSQVREMNGMFYKASTFNQDIGKWNTANVTYMNSMFYGASTFNQDIGNWKLNSNVYLINMLDNCGLDCSKYSSTLIGWQVNNPTVTGRNLGSTGREYGTNAIAARNALINTQRWTITGDSVSGTECSVVAVHNVPSIETMIFPNPVNDLITVVSSETGTMRMSDMYGEIILTQFIKEGKNEINVGQISSGFYIFTMKNGNKYKILKH